MTAIEALRRPAIAKLRVPTALAVPGPQIFPSDVGAIVTVTNWTERDEAGERHRGLLVSVALDAADQHEAVRDALGQAGVIVSLMSVAHAAAAGPLRPLIAYAERTDGGCDVVQFAEWPIEPSARRLPGYRRASLLQRRGLAYTGGVAQPMHPSPNRISPSVAMLSASPFGSQSSLTVR